MNIPFIDIHTHNPVDSAEIKSVPALFLQDIQLNNNPDTLFSAAVHPWHATKFNTDQVLQMLENGIKQPGFIAVGETGLDKKCKADFHQQKSVFKLHIEFAEKYHKPLIIHAVRSWNDLTGIIKPLKVPVILHGYSEGIELTKQLIDMGCYFSLGKSVLKISLRLREAIKIIPYSALFLETDDSLVDIKEIYHEVSSILELSTDELKVQIYRNFNSLFPGNKF
ncbi:MAG: TatD family hydrolase [Mariniphaga sp.]